MVANDLRRKNDGMGCWHENGRHAKSGASPCQTEGYVSAVFCRMPTKKWRRANIFAPAAGDGREASELSGHAGHAIRTSDAAVQVVHHPMKCRQVNRFDNPHVIERHMQVLLGQGPQLAAVEPG